MLKELRKLSMKNSHAGIAMLVVLGLLIIATQFSDLRLLLQDKIEFNTLYPKDIQEGMVVNISNSQDWGVFKNVYEKERYSDEKTLLYEYHYISVGDMESGDYAIMGIKVPAKQKISFMSSGTDTDTLVGIIKPLTGSDYDAFAKMYGSLIIKGINPTMLPYYIEVSEVVGKKATGVYVVTAVGALFILAAIYIWWRGFSGRTLYKFMQEIMRHEYSEEEVEKDYYTSRVFDSDVNFRVGNIFTYFMIDYTPHVVKNENIVWAYQYEHVHRKNGYKDGTYYIIMLYMNDRSEKKVFVGSNRVAREVMAYMRQAAPRAVLGYSDDLQRMYNQDYYEFLRIRYYTE